ncbi:MAG: RDD family protein [Thiotrichaceae bacterium]|nr:RDD family protein [Thiotrichaceae bacterium]
MNTQNNKAQSLLATGLFRRLAAIFYDSLLLFSTLFMATLLVQPLTKGNVSLIYQLYLLAIIFFYFAYPWKKSGQTLGMLAWRIRLESTTGQACTWQQLAIRFAVAIVSWLIAGLGFWWVLFNPERRAWHDLASSTRLVFVPKVSPTA